MSQDRLVLRYLDAPFKIIFFTIDEIMLLVIPLLIGTQTIGIEWGLLASGVLFFGYRKIKRLYRGMTFGAWVYWNLPFYSFLYKYPIRSDVRKFKG